MRALRYPQRLALLAILAGAGALLVLGRVFTLQVVQHGTMAERAGRLRLRTSLVRPPRGSILDARGRVLAYDDLAYDLVFIPRSWRDPRWECRYCGEVYHVARDREPPGRCVRCRRTRLPADPDEPVIVAADDRRPARLAGLLSIPTRELLGRIDAAVAEAEAAVEQGLAGLDERERSRNRAELWYDHGRRPVTLVRDVPYEVVREVALHPRVHPAFEIRPSMRRAHEFGPELTHLIGTTREVRRREKLPRRRGETWMDLSEGVSGVEGHFDDALSGRIGWVELEIDPRTGRKTLLAEKAARPGRTVQLTIDADHQRAAYAALRGEEGAFVVVEAETGHVLALATSPSFHPDDRRETTVRWIEAEQRAREAAERGGGPARVFGSPLIERSYRAAHIPGSIVKPVTALAAARAGQLDPAEEIRCDGSLVLRGRTLSTNRCLHPHGPVDLHGALVHSCNVYFQTLYARLLHANELPAFYRLGWELGLEKRTGLEVGAAEGAPAPGLWRPDPRLQEGALVASGMGQGNILLSPAQVARAYAALATGRVPELRVVRRAGDRQTAVRTVAADLDPDTLARVRAALADVPGPEGTARGYGLDRWDVRCKTGSAQLGRSGREPGLQNAWLAGFVPARAGRPAIAFAVVVCQTRHNGGPECGPRLREFLDAFYAEGGE